MSNLQVDVLSRIGATYVGIETTLGTTPGTMYRAFPTEDREFTNSRAHIVRKDERTKMQAYIPSIKGLKSGEGGMDFQLRPHATRLLTGATAPTGHFLAEVLRCWFGSMASGAGSTAQTGSTTTSIIVATGHGARFTIGTWIAVEVDDELHVVNITNKTTDTLTVRPALPGAPADGADVVNSETFFVSESDAWTLAIEHGAAQDPNYQWRANGAVITPQLVFTPGEDAMVKLAAKYPLWQGPAPLGISTLVGVDPLADPVIHRDAQFWLYPVASPDREHYPIKTLEPTFGLETVLRREAGGTLEGVVSRARAITRPPAMVKLATRADRQLLDAGLAYYNDNVDLSLVVVLTSEGGGTTARKVVVEFACGRIEKTPVYKKGDDGFYDVDTELHFGLDTACTGTTQAALSSARISLI
jgi:hypothetical protein